MKSGNGNLGFVVVVALATLNFVAGDLVGMDVSATGTATRADQYVHNFLENANLDSCLHQYALFHQMTVSGELPPRFAVFVPPRMGHGNRMLGLVSVFFFALATRRALLYKGEDIGYQLQDYLSLKLPIDWDASVSAREGLLRQRYDDPWKFVLDGTFDDHVQVIEYAGWDWTFAIFADHDDALRITRLLGEDPLDATPDMWMRLCGKLMQALYKPSPKVDMLLRPYLQRFKGRHVIGVQIRHGHQHGDQPKIDKCLGTALVESNSFSAARALDAGNSSLFFLVTDTPAVRQRFVDAMPIGRAEFQQEDLIVHSGTADESKWQQDDLQLTRLTKGIDAMFIDWWLMAFVDDIVITTVSTFAASAYVRTLRVPLTCFERGCFRHPHPFTHLTETEMQFQACNPDEE